MNIAFMIKNLNPSSGGTERVTYTVSNKLQNKGYNCFYIYQQNNYNKIDEKYKMRIDETHNKYECLLSFLTTNNINILVIVNQLYQTIEYQKIFIKLKLYYDFKLIACLHASPDNWKNKDKWGLVLPKTYIRLLLKSFIYKFYNPYKIRAKGMYEIADKYMLLSESYKNIFQNIMDVNDTSNKLVAIPNPYPFENRIDNFNKENIILIVARMDEDQKRIFIALKMWKSLEEQYPSWKLCIVGEGKDLNTYKHCAKKFKLTNITFEGHSNNVTQYYLKSKIFWMTSIWEGLPMTLVEAQQYGCICIAFDSFASITDIIKNNENGFIVPNNDVKGFIAKTKFLLENQSIIDNMINKSNQNINPIFNIESVIKAWENLFQSLIN